jgi:RNA-splicing ligase RtcB
MNDLNLKIFAKTCEPEVYSQVYRLMGINVFSDAQVRIMPDTHAGMGCVIGFTANLGERVVPNLVGVDIGCGMFVECLGKMDTSDEVLSRLDKFIREEIPSGSGVNERQGTRVEFPELEDMRMFKNLRNIPHLQSSIGSLGGGNHFIELNINAMGQIMLVIHTGSRNLGQQVCKYYQKMAIEDCNGHSAEIKREINAAIAQLKAEGRQKESSKVISEIKEKYHRIDRIPADLCYLEGEHRKDYLHDMKICQEFARRNREEIARRIIKFLKIRPEWSFHTIHNYIDFSDNIIRKGAIRCNEGELVIIPLNMRDGSIIAKGKGNPDWNFSGPHGAGRLMSRSKAKESISMDDFRDSMKDVFTTSVSKNTIDESPMAYKDSNEIVEAIQDTVEVLEIIKPIYNFKASETEDDYKRKDD